jgi:hypothetical protein
MHSLFTLHGRALRRSPVATFVLACMVLLTALQPLLNVHFNAQGWEDEPGYRVRVAGQSMAPEWIAPDPNDEASDLPLAQENTVFVQPSLDLGDASDDDFGALLWALTFALAARWLAWRAPPFLQRLSEQRCYAHWHAPPTRIAQQRRPTRALTLLHCSHAPPLCLHQ